MGGALDSRICFLEAADRKGRGISLPCSLPISLTKKASRSADSAEIKIEGGLKPRNSPYRNSVAL